MSIQIQVFILPCIHHSFEDHHTTISIFKTKSSVEPFLYLPTDSFAEALAAQHNLARTSYRSVVWTARE